jgi:putative endonuclease
MFWVYGIKSHSSGRIYIGQTNDLEKRLKSHNSGLVPSTNKDRLWSLAAYEICTTRQIARWREFQLKRSRGKRLKWLRENSLGLRAGGGEKAI